MTRRGFRGPGIALALSLALVSPARGAKLKEPTAGVETGAGLRRAIFETGHGRVVVSLPDDMAGGDAITGTVAAEPAGRSEKETRRNAEILERYVVEIDRAGTPVRARILKWTIPGALAGGQTHAVLKDEKGMEVARAPLPVLRPPAYATHPPRPAPDDFMVPDLGQGGAPIETIGPFDGDFATTAVKVGGQEARKLAESPRKFVAESPRGVLGRTTLELKEGPTVVTTAFRNLSQALSARKSELLRDEATVLTVRIQGLDGLEGPIAIRLRNRTPQAARLEGGETQTVSISPDHLEPGGVMTIARTLTGLRPGPFDVDCSVVAAPLARDPWHALKGLAGNAAELGGLLDGVARDLDADAASGGTAPEEAAAIKGRLDVCRAIAPGDLGDARRCADLALRSVPAARLAARLWQAGPGLYRSGITLMLGRLGAGGAGIPWDLIGRGLDIMVEGAEMAGDAEGAQLLRDTKRLADYVRQGRAPMDKLKEVLGLMVEYRPRPKPTPAPGPTPTTGPMPAPSPTPTPGATPAPGPG